MNITSAEILASVLGSASLGLCVKCEIKKINYEILINTDRDRFFVHQKSNLSLYIVLFQLILLVDWISMGRCNKEMKNCTREEEERKTAAH